MAKNRNQAKKMASKGASVKEIRKATGVKREAAQKFIQKAASRTSQTTTANNQEPAGDSTSPSRTTPKIKGVGQGIRIAGEKDISKSDYKTIAKAKGDNPEKFIAKLDKINTKLEKKGKTAINLTSGAANMLVRKGQKSSDKYRGFGANTPFFGEGAIGSTLQSMISTPARPGTWIKGELTGGREADPGFNPGGRVDKNRMIGGTVIRPDGTIAVKGTGQQYELPKRFRDEEDPKDPKDPIEEVISDPDEPAGPIQPIEPIEPIEPTEPVEEVDRSASSGAGGLDLASWATGFRKARSARQQSGRNAQGLASQKKNPFKSWA